jgi:hypothetical protein
MYGFPRAQGIVWMIYESYAGNVAHGHDDSTKVIHVSTELYSVVCW